MSKKGKNGKADNEKSTVKGCFPPRIGAVEPLFSQVLREPRFKANSMSRIRAVLVGTLISILSGCASDTVRTDVTSVAKEPPQPAPSSSLFPFLREILSCRLNLFWNSAALFVVYVKPFGR